MTLEELREEFRTEVIGPKILGEIRAAIGEVVKGYDPLTYGGVAKWEEGLEDLTQDFVAQKLLRERQLAYVMDVSLGIDDFRRLLRYHVHHQLASARRRTIIDNLLERCKDLLLKPPFVKMEVANRTLYRLEGAHFETREATETELKRAAQRVDLVPKERTSAAMERAPRIYSGANLRLVLQAIAGSLPVAFSLQDIDRILRLTSLTDMVPSFLVISEEAEEEAQAELEAPDVGPEDIALARDVVKKVLDRLTLEQLRILCLTLSNVSNVDISDMVKISRPTVIKRKQEIVEILNSELAHVSVPAEKEAMDELSKHCAEKGFL